MAPSQDPLVWPGGVGRRGVTLVWGPEEEGMSSQENPWVALGQDRGDEGLTGVDVEGVRRNGNVCSKEDEA